MRRTPSGSAEDGMPPQPTTSPQASSDAEVSVEERADARVSRLGLASFALLATLTVPAALAGLWKLLGVSWIAFAAMAGAAPLGLRAAAGRHAQRLVWSYGLAAGAMITSAAVFLVPEAVAHDAALGGFGIALGIVVGFGLHTLAHQLTHAGLPLEHTTAELTAHALADGAILGLVYAAMPDLGLVLGLAIVSHKGPAGYAAARRLRRARRPVSLVLLPASATGLAALAVGLAQPSGVVWMQALVLGFATGVFLHVAMDFLPRCELGGEIHEAAGLAESDHHLLDRLRWHAVASTAAGSLLVFAAWLLLSR